MVVVFRWVGDFAFLRTPGSSAFCVTHGTFWAFPGGGLSVENL